MALLPVDRSGSAVLPPSDYPLHLLLDWSPARRSRAGWAMVLAASLGVHLLVFVTAVQLPSLAVPSAVATCSARTLDCDTPLRVCPDVLEHYAFINTGCRFVL